MPKIDYVGKQNGNQPRGFFLFFFSFGSTASKALTFELSGNVVYTVGDINVTRVHGKFLSFSM